MNINNIHKVYFIGTGGIGMSALAKYMLHFNKEVAGYDRTPSLLTQNLSDLGMYIQFTDALKLIPEKFVKKDTLIVYTPAIKKEENRILNYFVTQGFNVVKRAEVLAQITQDTILLAVAGTHGKTSTSCLLGHILKENNFSATSFLGGIAENYNSNLLLGGSTYSVVEADEFDRSFLRLRPNYSCITSIDADHLDIYKKKENLVDAFKDFSDATKEEVFVKKGIHLAGTTFGIDENADYNATNIQIKSGKYVFDVKTPNEIIKNIKINQPGRHNVLNTMAALAMANRIGVSLPNIAKALLSYKGVQRRFTYRIQTNDFVLIDDYAHHPTEIDVVYQTLKELYPNKKNLVVFQPHLYSRTHDFQKEFIQSLAQFDAVLLLPIYPAREKPIQGVSSGVLERGIKEINKNVSLIKPSAISSEIKSTESKIVVMLGAGDISERVKSVVNELKKERL